MAAYLLSAGWVNLLPTRQSFQPSGQHAGVLEVHAQYFCIMRKPTPSTDQSVERHVNRAGSNKRTPSLISCMMASLDWLNALVSSSVHSNFVDGLSRVRNGFICFVLAKA
ncbi:hypothetical protein DPMN_180804 [Dreissena polymorpha]|uniref:Uncharacterized protein n=1 Tax=Dreissena polymorpha TaxID=45954 RepID=A0A9D4I4Q1_DREPO|nr:hypothetical protein DPMN_180804 [Dreissena polymorpha]